MNMFLTVRMMWIRIYAVVCAGVFLVFSSAWSAESAQQNPKDTAAKGAPHIKFSETQHDFSKSLQNTKLQHGFVFKNTGSGTLIIDEVKTSCGCTAALASGKEIPPAGQGTIDVTFNTGSRQGKNEKIITVTTNDPDHPRVELKISTDIQVPISLSYSSVNFSQVKRGQEHVRYIALAGDDKDKTIIKGVETANSDIKLDFKQEGFDGDKAKQIKVTLLPTAKLGRFFQKGIVHTDHAAVKDLELMIVGEVTGDIVIVPGQLHFGLFQKGGGLPERILTLRATTESTFRILDVKPTIPEITISIETVAPGKEYKLHAVLGQAFAGDSLNGMLLIKTDLKGSEQIEINIAGRALPPAAQQAPSGEAPSSKNSQMPPSPPAAK